MNLRLRGFRDDGNLNVGAGGSPCVESDCKGYDVHDVGRESEVLGVEYQACAEAHISGFLVAGEVRARQQRRGHLRIVICWQIGD